MKTLFISLLLFTSMLFSQELQVKVTTNFENLPVYNREILGSFAESVQNYLNTTRFTGQNWEAEKIQCTMNIFFNTGTEQNMYTAQVFLTSQRGIYNSKRNSLMLKIMDNSWNFNYEKGTAFYFNPTAFHSILSFLDYYAYLILGYDEDSYRATGGTPYFSRANDICLLGAASQYSKGWEKNSSAYSRRGMVEDLLNEKFRTFREAFYGYHYNGIDIIAQKKEVGQKNIAQIVYVLEEIKKKYDLKGVLANSFFEAKWSEIVEYLKNYSDSDIFKKLKKIDPPHASKYDEAMGN